MHLCKRENLLYRTFLLSRNFVSSVFLLGFFLVSLPAQASTQVESANHLINNMIRDVESYLASDSGDIINRTANITKLLDNHFDLPGIARFSAGPYWRAATKNERTIYIQTMRKVLIGTIVRNFDQLAGLRFTPTNTQTKGKKMVLVRGTFEDVAGNRPPISIGWRITTPSSSPAKVLDVEIENISMLVTQKQENIAIIRKNAGHFAALIETMKKRLKAQ